MLFDCGLYFAAYKLTYTLPSFSLIGQLPLLYINRFLSADSIVPNPFNPQDYNRFAYVRNNPVRYIDPSGHVCVQNGGGMDDEFGIAGNCNGGEKANYKNPFPGGVPAAKKPVKPKKDDGGGGGPLGGASGGSGGGGGTPPIINNPPAITNPTPSITPTPPNVVLPTATPNGTPNPFAEDPAFVTTQTPAPPTTVSPATAEGVWDEFEDFIRDHLPDPEDLFLPPGPSLPGGGGGPGDGLRIVVD
ncbi:MAG: RHS repeat-associated core domain-containing protein [Chloroflexota bacterium]